MKIPFLLLIWSIISTSVFATADRPELLDPGEITYIDKTGTVRAEFPGTTKFFSNSDHIRIQLFKTGGQAQTKVSIYIDNNKVEQFTIRSSTYNNTIDKVISNTKLKMIKIVINNVSELKTFKYRLKCTSSPPPTVTSNCLNRGFNGVIRGGNSKNLEVTSDCATVEFTLSRTGGRAAGRVSIYKYNVLVETIDFPRGVVPDTRKITLTDVLNKRVRLVVQNLSADKDLQFSYQLEGH
ncbi:MAG: hypothetical protein R2824_04105 [Saprospiraceae bacterium]|nr:hypothetical protein [Lewinella sp.]